MESCEGVFRTRQGMNLEGLCSGVSNWGIPYVHPLKGPRSNQQGLQALKGRGYQFKLQIWFDLRAMSSIQTHQTGLLGGWFILYAYQLRWHFRQTSFKTKCHPARAQMHTQTGCALRPEGPHFPLLITPGLPTCLDDLLLSPYVNSKRQPCASSLDVNCK